MVNNKKTNCKEQHADNINIPITNWKFFYIKVKCHMPLK